MKNQKGFTLIELLIVIGIIAILAAAVIIAINPGRQFQQARNATRWSHMNSVVNAVYSFAISNGGTFPDCVSNGPQDLAACSDGTGDDIAPDYMSEVPQDPSVGGDTYTDDAIDWDDSGTANTNVTCSSNCTGYIVGVVGGNRVKIMSRADEANTSGNEVQVVQ